MPLLLKNILVLMGIGLMSGQVWAQSDVRDPMLPPAQYLGATNAQLSDRASSQGTTTHQPVVQVLVIGRDRQSVVMDGRVLKSGEQLDQWRLVRVTDRGVVLRDGDSTQAISAYPAVSKKMVPGSTTGTGSKNTNP